MTRKATLVLLLILLSFLLVANMPAPWAPCQGKAAGDRCQYGYGCTSGQQCTLVSDSPDDPTTTSVNEQLQCR